MAMAPPMAMPDAPQRAEADELAALLTVEFRCAELSAVTDMAPAAITAVSSNVTVARAGFSPLVVLDTPGSEFQRRHDFGVTARRRLGDFALGDTQSLWRQADAVETLGVLDQGGIAARAQIRQNTVHDPGDIRFGAALDRKEGLEGGLEGGRARVQPMGHLRPPEAPRSSG
jgi:hypothetical protein